MFETAITFILILFIYGFFKIQGIFNKINDTFSIYKTEINKLKEDISELEEKLKEEISDKYDGFDNKITESIDELKENMDKFKTFESSIYSTVNILYTKFNSDNEKLRDLKDKYLKMNHENKQYYSNTNNNIFNYKESILKAIKENITNFSENKKITNEDE